MERRASWVWVWAMSALLGCAQRPSEPTRVAAASDLSAAFAELGKAFEKQTGNKLLFTFGATGLLARQLRERAPFDVFAAASASFVDDVVAAGACDARTRAKYGRGHLALWTRDEQAELSLAALRDARFKRIAIANPEHAPYGKAAREALVSAGLWSELEPRVVYAENVRQALQFAESGNAEAALVALSLVLTLREGRFVQVDTALHRPIEQELVVCRHGKNERAGRSFAEFVSSPAGRAIMRRYGFLLPGETLAAP